MELIPASLDWTAGSGGIPLTSTSISGGNGDLGMRQQLWRDLIVFGISGSIYNPRFCEPFEAMSMEGRGTEREEQVVGKPN